MIISYSILVFSIYNLLLFFNSKNIADDTYKYEYNIELAGQNVDWDNYINIPVGNIYINSDYLFIDELGMSTTVTGVLQNNEKINRVLMAGEYPENNDKQHLVVVGLDVFTKASENNGKKTITMSGISYDIVGVFSKRYSEQVDYSVYVFLDSLCQEEYEQFIAVSTMNGFSVSLRFASDIMDQCEYIRKYCAMLEGMGVEVRELSEATTLHDLTNDHITKLKTKVLSLVIIICLFNCLTSTSLWVKRRISELSIRKAFGYDNILMAKMLISDVSKLILISLPISLLLQTIYGFIKGILMINGVVLLSVLEVLIVSAIISIFIILIELKYVAKIMPQNGLKEK